jgi:hypothetical protein
MDKFQQAFSTSEEVWEEIMFLKLVLGSLVVLRRFFLEVVLNQENLSNQTYIDSQNWVNKQNIKFWEVTLAECWSSCQAID